MLRGGVHGVVPVAVEVVAGEGHRFEFGLGHGHIQGIRTGVAFGADFEALVVRGGADELDAVS